MDILDEEGTALLPVTDGKWFSEMSVGSHLLNYDSLVTLTHFKGHTQGGFGGSNKNIGIGCADGRIGKAWIHTTPGQPDMWDISKTCVAPTKAFNLVALAPTAAFGKGEKWLGRKWNKKNCDVYSGFLVKRNI